MVSAASHVLLSFVQHVLVKTLPDAQLALQVLLWILIMSVTVFQDTLKLTELVKHVQPSVMVAKLQASAQLALILKEDLIKTVIAQLVSSTMVLPSAKLVIHFARLVQILQPVRHASLKTTEVSPMDNVFAHQVFIKLLILTTLSVAEDAAQNAKNALVQTFA